MSEDLVNDDQWQDMLQVFREHFWAQRVPAFQAALASHLKAPETDDMAPLKASVHGLAGVAALVGLADVGSRAREIEIYWDSIGQPDQRVLTDLRLLEQTLDRYKVGTPGYS